MKDREFKKTVDRITEEFCEKHGRSREEIEKLVSDTLTAGHHIGWTDGWEDGRRTFNER